jgi:hypothetical protein
VDRTGLNLNHRQLRFSDVNSCTAAIIGKKHDTMKKQIVIGDFGPSPVAPLEHRDRCPNALINEHHENFSSLPRKTAQPPLVAARPRTCTSITGLLILQVSSSPSRQDPNCFQRVIKNQNHSVLCPCPVKNSIRSSFRPPFKGHACSAAELTP